MVLSHTEVQEKEGGLFLSVPPLSFHPSHFLNHTRTCECLTRFLSFIIHKQNDCEVMYLQSDLSSADQSNTNNPEEYLPHAYTVRQLIQLLSKDLLEKDEYFNLIGLLAEIEVYNAVNLLVVKDFEFDERVVIKYPSNEINFAVNMCLAFTDLISTDWGVFFEKKSKIQILSFIPSHEIEPRIPFFVSFPWFSPQFYIWLHVDIEMIYKFHVTEESCFCCFFANTLNESIHV